MTLPSVGEPTKSAAADGSQHSKEWQELYFTTYVTDMGGITMMMRPMRLLRLLLILAVVLTLTHASVGLSVAQTRSSTSSSTSRHDGVWTWSWSENGNRVELIVRGKVEFNDDYTAVRSISPDGSLQVRERRAGVNRRLEIEPSSGGGLQVYYYVDGQSRPYDNEAKAWFGRILTEAVVQSGLDAGPRVQRILRERGASSLLDEISRLRSDYVKHLYFNELFKSGSLDAQTTQQVLAKVAREMTSDYYKAEVLKEVAGEFHGDEAARTAYFEAAATIRSDYYREQSLSALLKQGNLSKEDLLVALKAAAEIGSDYYKTQALLRAAENSPDDEAVCSAYIRAAATISSDYYRGQSLSAVLKRRDLSRDNLLAALKAVARMSSDYYKAEVLLTLATRYADDKAVREAIVDAARSIGSDYHRGRVLGAIFK